MADPGSDNGRGLLVQPTPSDKLSVLWESLNLDFPEKVDSHSELNRTIRNFGFLATPLSSWISGWSHTVSWTLAPGHMRTFGVFGTAAPPCREYSRLKLLPGGPKALRTPAFLNGLPGLSASQALRVQESHLIFVRCVQLLHVSFSCGAQVSLEQPPNSMAWMEPIATNFLAAISADLVHVAACSVDLDMHKAWLFATSFRASQAFASTCPVRPFLSPRYLCFPSPRPFTRLPWPRRMGPASSPRQTGALHPREPQTCLRTLGLSYWPFFFRVVSHSVCALWFWGDPRNPFSPALR